MRSEHELSETERLGEQELIEKVRKADGGANWILGEAAEQWTSLYARGRTDADFARLCDTSEDRVNRCRRVWTRFGKTHRCGNWQRLSWKHFLLVVSEDAADEILLESLEEGWSANALQAVLRGRKGKDLHAQPDAVEGLGDEEAESSSRVPVVGSRNAAGNARTSSRGAKRSTVKEPTSEATIATPPVPAQAYAPFASAARKTAAPPIDEAQPQLAASAPPSIVAPAASLFEVEETQSLSKLMQVLNGHLEKFAALNRDDKSRTQLADYLQAWSDLIRPNVTDETPDVQEVVDEWNNLPKPFPQVVKLSDEERAMLKARLKADAFKKNWKRAVKKVADLPVSEAINCSLLWFVTNGFDQVFLKTGKPQAAVTFVPPTIDEWTEYCKEKGYTFDFEGGYAYYQTNGWRQSNGNKVVNWQGCCATCQKNENAARKGQGGRPNGPPMSPDGRYLTTGEQRRQNVKASFAEVRRMREQFGMQSKDTETRHEPPRLD